MAMKRLSGIVMTAVGVVLMLFGLLFLVGAGGQARRVGIGVAGLALGGLAAGFGVRRVKQADAESPEQLRAEIMALAAERSGEVSEHDIRAALGRRFPLAHPVLDDLLTTGTCGRRMEDGALYYLFEQLQPRLVHLVCEYCGAELPISEETAKCPTCGGTIKTQVARHALTGNDYFSMDEEA